MSQVGTPLSIDEAAEIPNKMSRVAASGQKAPAGGDASYSAANQADGSYYNLTGSNGDGAGTSNPAKTRILSGVPGDQQDFSASISDPNPSGGGYGSQAGTGINSPDVGTNQLDGFYYNLAGSNGAGASGVARAQPNYGAEYGNFYRPFVFGVLGPQGPGPIGGDAGPAQNIQIPSRLQMRYPSPRRVKWPRVC